MIYSGGGVINSGKKASNLLRMLVSKTNFPITSTLMGLGSYPASGENWLGMLGMHGTYEANMAMHDCDVLICIGARFDDRITGRTDAFSPNSYKIHIDIDPSSINKNIQVDVPLVSDIEIALKEIINTWEKGGSETQKTSIKKWWSKISEWKNVKCLAYKQTGEFIKPQYAIDRLEKITSKPFCGEKIEGWKVAPTDLQMKVGSPAP